MLEDRDSIDILLHDPGKWVKFVIIDSGEMRDRDSDKHLDLLNHKIACCLSYLADENKFAELGSPADVTIEIRCAYAVRSSNPLLRSATFDSGRTCEYKVIFIERKTFGP